jgi:LacI family transcriptional regulator
MHGRVDGLLLMSPQGDGRVLEASLAPDLPAVLINTRPGAHKLAAFEVDNRGGARAMVRHLVAAGHRYIAFIAGPEHHHDAAERRAGYREALAQERPGTAEQVLPGDFTEASGHRAGQWLAGFDDVPIARYMQPALTTVRLPIVELGTLALEALAAAIESPNSPAPPCQTLRAELVVRQSGHLTSRVAGRPANAPLNGPDGPP